MITQIGNINTPFIGGNPTPIVVEVQSDLYPKSSVDIERTFANIDIMEGNWRLRDINIPFTTSDFNIGQFILITNQKVKIIDIDIPLQRITIDYSASSITSNTFKRVFNTYRIVYNITTGYSNVSSQPLKDYKIETIPDLENIASVNISSLCRTRFQYDNKIDRLTTFNDVTLDTDLHTKVSIIIDEYYSYTEEEPITPNATIALKPIFVVNGNTIKNRNFYSDYTIDKNNFNKKSKFLRNTKIVLYEPDSYLSNKKYNCDVAFLVTRDTSLPTTTLFIKIKGGGSRQLEYFVSIDEGYLRFNINNDRLRAELATGTFLVGQDHLDIEVFASGSNFKYIEDKVYFADKSNSSIFPVCNPFKVGNVIPTFLEDNEVGISQVFVTYLTALGSWETFLFRGLGSINLETTNEQSRNNWIYNPNNTRNINNEVIAKTVSLGGTLRTLPLPQSDAIVVMRDLFTSLRVFDEKNNLLVLDENSLSVDSKDKNIAFAIDYKTSINPLIQRI